MSIQAYRLTVRSRRTSNRFPWAALLAGIALGFVPIRAAAVDRAHPAIGLEASFPLIAQWGQAGVPDGIPTSLPVVGTVKPGDDLQAAIDQAPDRGGVIAVAPGDYVLTQTLRLRSGVFLRGAGPRITTLHLNMRGARPDEAAAGGLAGWTTGILFQTITNAGLANFTLAFDESLPPPPDPRTTPFTYQDNPGGRTDLYVVAVGFNAASECWIANCVIRNSGTNPLVIENSRHLTVSSVEITGTYNKGPRSGRVELAGSDHVLIEDLLMRDTNSFVVRGGPAGQGSRYNVIVNSRIESDVRFHDAATTGNLLQNTVIAVPAWHNRPALSQGRADEGDRPPGPGNLLYLCTVTRAFLSGSRSFSVADNPTRVYRVLESYSNDASIADAGAAPMTGSLWPAR